MGANPTIQLAIIRSQIDQQQQVVSLLEGRLQQAILGGTTGREGVLDEEQGVGGLLLEIADIYGDSGSPYETGADNDQGLTGLSGAIWKGVLNFNPDVAPGDPDAMVLEQDGLRQLLYQARALLGELRVEEQHWNGEVNEEKARRKELGDLSKA